MRAFTGSITKRCRREITATSFEHANRVKQETNGNVRREVGCIARTSGVAPHHPPIIHSTFQGYVRDETASRVEKKQ